MKPSVCYIDRSTGRIKEEKIYHESALRFLYETAFGRFLAYFIVSNPLFSKLYGWWQSLSVTKHKILPFVQKFEIDTSEFADPLSTYSSFNAFFIRKLKHSVRPLAEGLILPADGRYLFYQDIEKCDGFIVKGKKFQLTKLIGNESLAQSYQAGSMIIARLCPTDYHRFHFPCDCIPGTPRLINGPLFSVNPIALKQQITFLTENKRVLTLLKTTYYGEILFIEIGATNVGSIHQTYRPHQPYKKGDEKGYFSFGGSSIILLFQSNQIQIDQKLLTNSSQHLETLCLFGQSLESKN